jgi:putative endonuclease
MGRTQQAGREAEARAESMLRRNGLVLLVRNYRCRAGEIDLVMRDADQLVFVEVRYRSHGGFGGALCSVGATKQRKLICAAQHYLMSTDWQGPCRFDVVGFDRGQTGQWIRDAFTA